MSSEEHMELGTLEGNELGHSEMEMNLDRYGYQLPQKHLENFCRTIVVCDNLLSLIHVTRRRGKKMKRKMPKTAYISLMARE